MTLLSFVLDVCVFLPSYRVYLRPVHCVSVCLVGSSSVKCLSVDIIKVFLFAL